VVVRGGALESCGSIRLQVTLTSESFFPWNLATSDFADAYDLVYVQINVSLISKALPPLSFNDASPTCTATAQARVGARRHWRLAGAANDRKASIVIFTIA
jgi:hypothetical protein